MGANSTEALLAHGVTDSATIDQKYFNIFGGKLQAPASDNRETLPHN